jgi:hypothetical protein
LLSGKLKTLSPPLLPKDHKALQDQQAGQAGSGLIVDDAAKIDKSVVYYDAATNSYKANAIWTISTIVDGANF